MMAEKELNFVDRYRNPSKYPSIKNDDGSISTHRMADTELNGRFLAYPTIVQLPDGELMELDENTAITYALQTGEYKEFPDQKSATSYAANGYKSEWGSGEKKVRPVRVKGVTNPMQFPGDMTDDEIKVVLRQKFKADMFNRATGATSDLLAPAPQTIEAYEPTLTENTGMLGGLLSQQEKDKTTN